MAQLDAKLDTKINAILDAKIDSKICETCSESKHKEMYEEPDNYDVYIAQYENELFGIDDQS